MAGFEHALLVAAGIAVVGAIVAAVLIRPHDTARRGATRARSRPRRCERGTRTPGSPAGGAAPAGDRAAALRVFSAGELRRRDDGRDRARGGRHASRSSTATSPRSATCGSRASTQRGTSSGTRSTRRLAALATGGGRRPGRGRRGRSRSMPNLWIQGITEAGEDRRSVRRRAATCARCTTSSPPRSAAARPRARCRPTATPTPRRGSSSAGAAPLGRPIASAASPDGERPGARSAPRATRWLHRRRSADRDTAVSEIAATKVKRPRLRLPGAFRRRDPFGG